MKLKYIISFILIILFTDILLAQNKNKNKKDEMDIKAAAKAAFKEEISGHKQVCRAALKPYRYDGVKTTQFIYKSFEYIKEVEIATIQNAEYRLSYNTNGIHHDKIKMQIYDKSSKDIRRVLLYEKSEIGGNEFSFETNLMIEKLKQSKLDKGIDSVIVNQMRLKKIFVNYIIPAIEKTTEINEFGENVTVKLKGAVILCVGYSNL
tara:strand:+ start:358 stop:975 length:618 start_codon:yes stop_codon:yes gene_type:complete